MTPLSNTGGTEATPAPPAIVAFVGFVMASLCCRATFFPPGGNWDHSSAADDPISYVAGTAIMETNHPIVYSIFLMCGMLGFLCSVGVILLSLDVLGLSVYFRRSLILLFYSLSIGSVVVLYTCGLYALAV